MDTELLKTFLEVQRTRHFGKAAENLYLTQSAVSFRIRQLEQQLGVNLFVRYRNNIQLTAAGERLLPHAQTMLSALQLARQDVALSGQQAKQLSLAAPTTVWETLLTSAFLTVQQQTPQLYWRTDNQHREQLTRNLLEHQLDLAILFDPPKVEEITITALCQIKLWAVSSVPASVPADKHTDVYCYVDWGSAFEAQHMRFFGDKLSPVLRTSSSQLALDWLLQNAGAAYLPESMVSRYLDSGSLHLIDNAPCVDKTLYAAYLTDNQHQTELLQVIELLKTKL